MKKPVVAILGATGAVGQEFIRLIEERQFPYSKLILLASSRSAGKKMSVNGHVYTVEEATPESFTGVDIGLFAGGAISKTLAPEAAKRGCVVIDNSSAFRMDKTVPLVIPEINAADIAMHQGIIANPNCSTIIMLMALKPIYDLSPITKIIVSTYQAVSGAGKEGIEELETEVKDFLQGKEMEAHVLPTKSLDTHYPIAFNLIPHIDVFLDNDYSKEEMKMVHETHKILHNDTIAITATTVRVPVFRSHAESIYVETEKPISVEAVRQALDAFPGVQVEDDLVHMKYPMPLYTSEKYDCYVGRIRKDLYNEKAVNLWVCGDQIRKGAALNALQIAEYMLAHDLLL
ncbi:aspartate-semialdehyde dehydrogenase [uncultured Megasphaera sp.]|uniref:aspartate-semialdehyde dehydrogenase n=1 Tax=uncultured Megasphaera sp. TaxID=165188 RepID=UPI0025990F9F|nr:aspartate-semialdehyde dehydrogenase [uncultured Megasphaera sp.]